MNKPKKIICVLLAAITVISACAMFASCEKKPSGEVLATYAGGQVYESQVLNWQKYFLIENIQEISQAEDYQAKIAEINDRTTTFYVQMKAFRKMLADKGIATITDDMIKKYTDEVLVPAFEEQYSSDGGLDYWLKKYNVTKDFVYDYAENSLVSAYLEQYVMTNYGVEEKSIYEYWESHSYKYLVVPSYNFDVIMVPVADSDKADPEAWDAAKAEAEGYIARIKAGESFADVKASAIENSKNVAISKGYSVTDSVPIIDCDGFENKEENDAGVEAFIAAYGEANNVKLVRYADPKGDSKEYMLWYAYVNMFNEADTKYALPRLDVGETYSEPIINIEGYEIIMLVEKSDETEFQRPENNQRVYDDIYETLYNDLWDGGTGPAVEEFEADLKKAYNIEIKYSYLSNYS